MASQSQIKSVQESEPVSKGELNSWRRGFTPQAEIWNGRMAMAGLFIGFFSLIAANFFLAN